MGSSDGGRKKFGRAEQMARVLVVDDDRAIRELIHAVLERPDLEVGLAQDAKQALSFLRWDSYNVVVLGLQLPDMDGLALLRSIREHSPDTQVVVLCGPTDRAGAVEALRLGACHYLRKPLENVDILNHVVSRALERQEILLTNRYLMSELVRVSRELRRQRRRELRRLEELGLALAGALRHQEILEVLERTISAAVPCSALALYLFDPELGGPSVRIHSQRPLDDAQFAALREAVRRAGAPTESLERAVANAEVTVHAAEVGNPPVALGAVAASLLAVRGRCLGAVAVGAEHSAALKPEELQIFRILCNQGAAALENARLFHQAQLLATRDGLTGLLNHRTFYERLEEEISRARRYNLPLSLAILDTDCLKRINDRHGHLAGDEMLRVFARLLSGGLRRSDVIARYGGDEFAILLPHTTAEAAGTICERLRGVIESHPFVVGDSVEKLGASFGVAGYDAKVDKDGSGFVHRADEALYRAKSGGRNRVEVAVALGK